MNIDIYVDASVISKSTKASWAWVINHNIFDCGEYKLLDRGNVFKAELMSIYQAIKWVNNQMISCDVTIYCDSKSVVNACNSKFTKKTDHIWASIIEQRDQFKFKWIPRCSNNQSELADHLARTCTKLYTKWDKKSTILND